MPAVQKKYLNILFISLVLILTTIIYYKSLHFEFINWDDDRQVYENQDIRTLTFDGIHKIFSTVYLKMYQPLTTLSFAVEYKFNQANPHIYHLHNLVLHLLNGLLVFIFVFLLIRNSLVSALVAFLFALHPMHVESVAWITERKDVLYSFFYLLSLITYILYLRKNRNIYWLSGSIIFFICSLLSKSAAITLPLILFLIDYKERRSFKLNIIPDKIPYLILSILFVIISIVSQKVFDPTIEMSRQFHFYERFLLGAYAFFFYILKLIIPTSLTAIHPFPIKTSILLPLPYFIALLCFIFFYVYLIWLLIKKKFTDENSVTILFGIIFFCLTISLVIFVPVGSAFAAERYTYIPYIGLFISLAYFIAGRPLPDHELKIRNFIIYPLFGLWLIFLSVTTFYRLDVWKNSMSFWNDAIKKNPTNVPIAYNNRGVTKYHLHDYSGAIPDFTKAIHLHPLFKDAYQYRALSRFFINDFTNAIRDFDTAIMIDPANADAFINRGQAKANFSDFNGAINDFSKAASINPNDYLPYYNRGILLSLNGKKAEAYNDFSTAIRLDPSFAAAYYARGMIALDLENKQQACSDFNQAAQLGNKDGKTELLNHCQ